MGAPLPLEGVNPYSGMYQQRQFGVGSPYAPISLKGVQQQVTGASQSLANPSTAMLNALAVNPLEERADFYNYGTQYVTVYGSPASGTFALQYGTQFTNPLAYNASAATVQTALRGLGGALASVNVAGNAGGPWTVTGFTGAGTVPLQLLRTRNVQLPGKANVVVTTTGGQPGIQPF